MKDSNKKIIKAWSDFFNVPASAFIKSDVKSFIYVRETKLPTFKFKPAE